MLLQTQHSDNPPRVAAAEACQAWQLVAQQQLCSLPHAPVHLAAGKGRAAAAQVCEDIMDVLGATDACTRKVCNMHPAAYVS